MIKFKQYKIGPVYWIKRGSIYKRLRIKINRKTYYCGDVINNELKLIYIEKSGLILFRDLKNETIYNFKVGSQ